LSLAGVVVAMEIPLQAVAVAALVDSVLVLAFP
jgi:hypothetical protein